MIPIQEEAKVIEDKIEQDQFDTSFKQATTEPEEGQTSVASLYSDYTSGLGTALDQDFRQAESDRSEIEKEWIKDLRQNKGEYDPEILAKIHPKRSKAYLSLTRTKVKTVTAREMDILFPASGERNWGIDPTPIPELNPEHKQAIIQQITEITGEAPQQDQINQILNEEAKRRSDNMEREMADQLSELKYRSIINDVIRSGNIYGTGILKGPLVKKKPVKRWLSNKDGGWDTIEMDRITPYCEFVPIWDIYPDMTARRQEDMRHIFQRYVMPRNKVYELAKRDDFKGEAIEAYLKAYPEGDAEYKTHEQDLRNLAVGAEQSSAFSRNSGKYEVKEFWGYISTDKLKEVGVNVPEDQVGVEVAANIWLLGPLVIKAVISPIEGVTFPYFFYYYEKDETSIFGVGIPQIMRDSQTLFNASVRAMLDNAAISAGPIIEANMDLLAQGEDPTDMYPFRVFQRGGTGLDAAQRAIHVDTLPSYTQEYLTMVRFFLETADEVTAVPRYMYGDQSNLGGAGKTATGLSMLMGASNITLKDQIKHFDDGITKPFIKSLYFWNMEFNAKDEVKGDFDVVCKGSSSLIAKEVRTEALIQFLSITNNEMDMQFIRRDNLLREMVKVMDLDDAQLIKGHEQVSIEQQQAAQGAEEDKQFEQQLAVTKAESGGHMQRPQMESVPTEDLEAGVIPEVSVSG